MTIYWVATAVGLLILCVLFFSFVTYLLWNLGGKSVDTALPHEAQAASAILVLAHFLDGDHLSLEYEVRCCAALRLWKEHHRPILLMGGQTKGSSVSQAKAAADWFERQGVDPSWIRYPLASNWNTECHDTLMECCYAADRMAYHNLSSLVFVTNRLQAIQVHYALLMLGARAYAEVTDNMIRTRSYLVKRVLMVPATALDPRGRLFSLLRWSRRTWLGSRL